MSNGGKKDRRPSGDDGFPKITLPWLIIGIASMFMFMAFLISMYFEFHTALFFAVCMWIISAALIFDGVSRRKKSKASGNLSLCMGVLAFIAGVAVLNL